jgi:hypothetical protein
MDKPKTTRLRFAKSKDPAMLSAWLDALGGRVQVYGCPQFDGKRWVLWFVPSDEGNDINSIDIDEV